MRRACVRHAGTARSPDGSAIIRMLAPTSIAKIEMNFPSASTELTSQIHQFTPLKSPYAVGFHLARLGKAKSWICAASMPSTPSPRSTSSDAILPICELDTSTVGYAHLDKSGGALSNCPLQDLKRFFT